MHTIYEDRQNNLRAYLQTTNQSVAVIMSPKNVYYFTGFQGEPHERFMALVLFKDKKETILFLPTLDLQVASSVAFVEKLHPISDTEDAYGVFATELGHVTKIALEKAYLSVTNFERLVAHYPRAIFSNITDVILQMRRKKSRLEIDHVRAAIEIAETGLTTLLEKIRPNLTELQVKAMLEYELTMLGAEGFAFQTTVLSGENSALPHGSSGQGIIKTGDFLLIDFGIVLNGYCSDITRTFLVGDASTEQIAIYEAVLAANEAAIDQVKLGGQLREIDLAARKTITDANYGEYFTHRVGHGLGLDVHEEPSIHHENEGLVEEGLLFTIEPGIYVPGFGGVRIEDNIYVNEQGEVEVLTAFPKKLISI